MGAKGDSYVEEVLQGRFVPEAALGPLCRDAGGLRVAGVHPACDVGAGPSDLSDGPSFRRGSPPERDRAGGPACGAPRRDGRRVCDPQVAADAGGGGRVRGGGGRLPRVDRNPGRGGRRFLRVCGGGKRPGEGRRRLPTRRNQGRARAPPVHPAPGGPLRGHPRRRRRHQGWQALQALATLEPPHHALRWGGSLFYKFF